MPIGTLVLAAALASPYTITWCGGTRQVDLDRWGDSSGIHTVFGWSYVTRNGHSAALRVDDSAVYAQPPSGSAAALVTTQIAVDPVLATGLIVQEALGLGRVITRLSGQESAGCCSLRVEVEVENIDAIPHTFAWRWFHDTAYEFYVNCPSNPVDPDVDGGEVCLPGETPGNNCEIVEFDALARGALGCEMPIRFYSTDTGLPGPVYVIDDAVNRPDAFEVMSWEALAQEPVLLWTGFVNGERFESCFGDNSILLVWKLPQDGGPLAPGAKARLAYTIGHACAPSCCAGGTPGDLANTLKLVRRDPQAEATFATDPLAASYGVRRASDKAFATASDEATGLAGPPAHFPVPASGVRYHRVRGVSCGGVPGP